MPSNIGCVGETVRAGNVVRCDMARRDWSPPRRPGGCTLDWGQGLTLKRTGRARFAGDTALNRGRVVAYGTRITIGGIVCTSRRTGLTCVNVHWPRLHPEPPGLPALLTGTALGPAAGRPARSAMLPTR